MKLFPTIRYSAPRLILAGLLTGVVSFFISITAQGADSVSFDNLTSSPKYVKRINEYGKIYLPILLKGWPPYPDTPTLNPIDNSDQDNLFTVAWLNFGVGGQYILEESNESSFATPNVVYQGSGFSWEVQTPGKLPGYYFYRVKTINQYGESNWSEIQGVRIYPLYVGLRVRWDGSGFIRGELSYDIGSHQTKFFSSLIDADTIRCDNRNWYYPNPLDFESESYTTYFSVTTGEFRSSSSIDDPSWKWGAPWRLSYEAAYQNDTKVKIGGQDFTVTGPHSGYTSFGTPIQYWEFINQDRILMYDDGEGYKQYVDEGDARLRYDAGESRLQIFEDIKRQIYIDGDRIDLTVQYIDVLSAATSLPGSPPVVLGDSGKQLGEQNGCAIDTCPSDFSSDGYKQER